MAAKTGNRPGQRAIQFIGTPPSRCAAAAADRAAEPGCMSAKRDSSRACNDASRVRSIPVTGGS